MVKCVFPLLSIYQLQVPIQLLRIAFLNRLRHVLSKLRLAQWIHRVECLA